jgi:hypothetical protein
MKTLREIWAEALKEPIPAGMRELLEMLDETPPLSDSHTERGNGSEGGSTHGG